MWDSNKDYRLLIAQKSKDLFERTIESGSFRGRWNKKMAREIAKNLNTDFQTLLYSYMEPKDMANSKDVEEIKSKAHELIKYLGGEDWYHIFLREAKKEDKEKTEESVAKVKFFLRTLLGLKERLAHGPINDPIIGIDIIVGEIMSTTKHPNADNLLITNININNQAIKVVTNDLDVKEGNRVGISMLPPVSFQGIVSEGMFLGADEGVLKDVQGELGQIPKGFPIESLNETRNLIESFLK
ncbi:MAG: tRNA-binding protein [Methanobrevibacter sp.]|jgi:predicted RNA-binding protein with EMAP domain|nr:tRNA-binding protein [Methanobrevibacter sp.]